MAVKRFLNTIFHFFGCSYALNRWRWLELICCVSLERLLIATWTSVLHCTESIAGRFDEMGKQLQREITLEFILYKTFSFHLFFVSLTHHHRRDGIELNYYPYTKNHCTRASLDGYMMTSELSWITEILCRDKQFSNNKHRSSNLINICQKSSRASYNFSDSQWTELKQRRWAKRMRWREEKKKHLNSAAAGNIAQCRGATSTVQHKKIK